MIALVFPGVSLAQEKETQSGSDSSQQLLDRIDQLEKQLNKLEQEGKARKKLEITEQEKVQREKEVLEAAGREYTMEPQKTLTVDYSLTYAYSPNETLYTLNQVLQLERNANHSITHEIALGYSLLDNLSISTGIPFMYLYNKRGTIDELDETDIGDISLSTGWQPIKSAPGEAQYSFSLGCSLPTGRSPYKINPKTELATGNGTYSVSTGATFSKTVDPVVVYGNVGYGYSFGLKDLDYTVSEKYILEEVGPSDSFSFGMGMGYALSYTTSINMSFGYSYSFSTDLEYKDMDMVKTGDSVSATFGLGLGWKIHPKTTMTISLGYSLTGTGFSLSLRLPFSMVT